MGIKVFVLGRPGSGKSTAIQHFITLAQRKKYAQSFLQDYEFLYSMFRSDHRHRKFRPTDWGGFDVIDYSVLDEALKQLECAVRTSLAEQREKLVLVEFARGDYRNALRAFSPGFLQDAYFFFVDADLEHCLQRVHQRVTYPPRMNRHFVSDRIMCTYYDKDNWDYMAYHFKREYNIRKEVAVFRNTGSLSELLDAVSDFAEMIFCREFSPPVREDRSGSGVGVMRPPGRVWYS